MKTSSISFFLFTIIVVVCFYSYSSCNAGREYVGTYQIDLEKSQLGNYINLHNIQNLKLEITDDHQFLFSNDLPFLFDKQGTWDTKLVNFRLLAFHWQFHLVYSKSERTDDLLFGDTNHDIVYLKSPLSKKNYQQVERLYFNRIK